MTVDQAAVANLMPLTALVHLALEDVDRKTRKFVERRINQGRWQVLCIGTKWFFAVPRSGSWLLVTDVPDATVDHLRKTGLCVPVGDA